MLYSETIQILTVHVLSIKKLFTSRQKYTCKFSFKAVNFKFYLSENLKKDKHTIYTCESTMPDKNPSQSINISGSSFSSSQFGQAGRDQTQTQQIVQTPTNSELSQEKVLILLANLESLLKTANLPQNQQDRALRYLDVAKEEAQSEKPDKKFTADSLKKVAGVLKEINETLETTQKIWDKVQPVFKQLLPWLGVSSGFFF